MTQAEADKIATLIRTADGGCSTCVNALAERFSLAGLGFVWTVIGDVEVQAEWSDDPEDTQTWPNVIAAPIVQHP